MNANRPAPLALSALSALSALLPPGATSCSRFVPFSPRTTVAWGILAAAAAASTWHAPVLAQSGIQPAVASIAPASAQQAASAPSVFIQAASTPSTGTNTLAGQKPAPATPTAYQRNWRDAFTPLADPLSAMPGQLKRPLQLRLPPELLPTPADSSTASTKAAEVIGATTQTALEASSPPTALLASIACATPDQANSLNSPQQALALLQSSQPAAKSQTASNTKNKANAPATLLLTLPQAVQLALCHNPQMRTTWSQITQHAAALGQARSAWLPQISAGISRQRSQQRFTGTPQANSSRTTYANSQNMGLRWRLWDFGARHARSEAARLQLQAALASQHATVHQALVEVLQRYTQAQIAQSRLQAQQALLPLAQRSLQAAQNRQKQGAGSASDTLQVLGSLARTNLELSRSQGDYHKALAQLIHTLGLPAQTPIRPQEPTPLAAGNSRQQKQNQALVHQALDEWLQTAQENHPAIAAAKAQWQAAQANLKAVQADGLPTLDVSYHYYRNGRPDQTLSNIRSREKLAGITLSIPVFDGFGSTYKVRSAQALAEQKAVEYQNTQQQVSQELVEIHADAQAAWRNLNAAHGLLLISQESLQSAQNLYQSGAADILQLNQALANLQYAQQEHNQAQAEWLRARLRVWMYAPYSA